MQAHIGTDVIEPAERETRRASCAETCTQMRPPLPPVPPATQLRPPRNHLGRNEGEITAKLWRNYGKNMAKLWRNYGEMMAKLWRNYGEIMAKLWRNCGEIMAKLWRNYGGVANLEPTRGQ